MQFDLSERIYSIMKEKRQKQSAVAVASGLDPKKFNAMLKHRKKIEAKDIPGICRGLGVTPDFLFMFQDNQAS